MGPTPKGVTIDAQLAQNVETADWVVMSRMASNKTGLICVQAGRVKRVGNLVHKTN